MTDCYWFSGEQPTDDNLRVKIRHGEFMHTCRIEEIDSHKLLVTLDKNDQGIAPGQFAVFYRDDICLGSGVIE